MKKTLAHDNKFIIQNVYLTPEVPLGSRDAPHAFVLYLNVR